MIVIQKYGGSILNNTEDIIKIGDKILEEYEEDNKYIIVLSAFKNKTDQLINTINKLSGKIDQLYSQYITLGEIETCLLLTSYLTKYLNVAYLDSQKLNIQCTNDYLDANILSIDINILKDYLNHYDIIVVPGFQGVNEFGEIVSIGRNGTDTTAIYIYNECSKITKSRCILYKDTTLYQADPKLKKSKHHENISYEQIRLLSNYGNPIISTKSISILEQNKLDVILKNIDTNEQTIINDQPSSLTLLTIIPKLYKEITINNVKNNKLINYLKHIFKNDYLIIEENIRILTNKKIDKYLDIIFLIDPNITFSIKTVLYYKYIYNDKITYVRSDDNDFKI